MKMNGKMIYKIILEQKNGMMDHYIKVDLKKEKNVVLVLIFGVIVQNIMVNGIIILLMIGVFTFLKIRKFIQVNGLIMK